MTRCIFMFPGQGAWSPGTGRDLHAGWEVVANTFARASTVLGEDVAALCFQGEPQANDTYAAHLAIYVLSMATDRILRDAGHSPDLCIGHSLGEAVAAVAAECLGFEDGLQLLRARGTRMAAACRDHPGGMVAVRGLPLAAVEGWLAELDDDVQIANVNGDDEIVVAGGWDGLKNLIRSARARRTSTVALRVAGAFHSPRMQQAAAEFRGDLARFRFRDPRTALVCGTTGQLLRTGSAVAERLAASILAPVRWDLVLRDASKEPSTRWIEVGPGKALTGLVRRAHRHAEVQHTGTAPSLRAALESGGPAAARSGTFS